MNIEIKETKLIHICQAEQFAEALREISKHCGLTGINYNKLGITKLEFSDGSTIGGLRIWVEAGIVPTSALD